TLGASAAEVLAVIAGVDVISGLAVTDRLTGGLGNDTFVFAPGFGNDTITASSRAVGNRDIIDLSAFHFASGTDALSHAVANGADTVFNFGNGDTLTVQNTAAGNITNLLVDDLKLSGDVTPTVTQVTTSPTSGEVTANQTVTISLAMNENVTVSGAPTLLLSDGGVANYNSGSGSSTLVFNYNVNNGEVTSDLGISGIVLPSPWSILDLTGTRANLAGAGADTKLGVNTPPGSPAGPSGGSFTIADTTELELFGPSTASVSFGTTGVLKLDASSQFSGQVVGFSTGGDSLDLADIAFGSNTTLGYAANSNNTGGTLTVSDGTHTANIALLGQYMAASFAMSADGFGGTLIHDTPT